MTFNNTVMPFCLGLYCLLSYAVLVVRLFFRRPISLYRCSILSQVSSFVLGPILSCVTFCLIVTFCH